MQTYYQVPRYSVIIVANSFFFRWRGNKKSGIDLEPLRTRTAEVLRRYSSPGNKNARNKKKTIKKKSHNCMKTRKQENKNTRTQNAGFTNKTNIEPTRPILHATTGSFPVRFPISTGNNLLRCIPSKDKKIIKTNHLNRRGHRKHKKAVHHIRHATGALLRPCTTGLVHTE